MARDPEKRREQNRRAQQRWRDRQRNPGPGRPPGRPRTRKAAKSEPPKPPEEVVQALSQDPPDVRTARTRLYEIGMEDGVATSVQVSALKAFVDTSGRDRAADVSPPPVRGIL